MSGDYSALLARLGEMGSVLVAYSGGIDSTLLAVAARDALGDRTVAVLASSPTYTTEETAAARTLAADLRLDLVELSTSEITDPAFADNTPDRCYHCKSELLGRMQALAAEKGLAVVADGTNADDLKDYRPGMRAAAELGIVSPLAELEMTKTDIRRIAREIGLPNWDKPSMACLASRFPYGERITLAGLGRVAAAEKAVRALTGVTQLRVRAHGDLARIEVAPEQLAAAWACREAIGDAVRGAGFAWVAIDVDGYRTGSLNATLDGSKREDDAVS